MKEYGAPVRIICFQFKNYNGHLVRFGTGSRNHGFYENQFRNCLKIKIGYELDVV